MQVQSVKHNRDGKNSFFHSPVTVFLGIGDVQQVFNRIGVGPAACFGGGKSSMEIRRFAELEMMPILRQP